MGISKDAIDEALEKAITESHKKADEILDRVSALVNGIAAEVKSFGEAKFRRDIIKLALEATQKSQVALLTALDAEQASRYTLAVADKLAPLPRAATPDTSHGYTLTDEEAAQVLAASK